MELTSFKPPSLPLVHSIQIESECISFRGLRRKGLWQSRVSGLKWAAAGLATMSWLHLFTSGPWQTEPGPSQGLCSSLLLLSHWTCSPCSLLPTSASVSSQSMMDDHNNSACLDPWQRGLGELMKACRLHTQGVPPGQQALPSLELASSLVGKEFFLMLLRQCKRKPKGRRLQGWRCGSD